MNKSIATACYLILSSTLIGGAAIPGPIQEATDRPEIDRVIEIIAERFLFTPSQITIASGTTVELRLTSEDTDHGFRLVGPGGIDIDVDIPKRNRGAASVFFSPTELGEYRFECSRICGAGHLYMSGIIHVMTAPSEPAAEDSIP